MSDQFDRHKPIKSHSLVVVAAVAALRLLLSLSLSYFPLPKAFATKRVRFNSLKEAHSFEVDWLSLKSSQRTCEGIYFIVIIVVVYLATYEETYCGSKEANL